MTSASAMREYISRASRSEMVMWPICEFSLS